MSQTIRNYFERTKEHIEKAISDPFRVTDMMQADLKMETRFTYRYKYWYSILYIGIIICILLNISRFISIYTINVDKCSNYYIVTFIYTLTTLLYINCGISGALIAFKLNKIIYMLISQCILLVVSYIVTFTLVHWKCDKLTYVIFVISIIYSTLYTLAILIAYQKTYIF